MRHNAAMGVIAIASCAAVVSSTLIGPMTRLRHHSERFYSHNRRLLTGVASGYIGGDSEVATMVASPLSSPRAQLLLADFAEKADDTPDAGPPAESPPPNPFPFGPSRAAPASPPTPPAPAASPGAPPVLPVAFLAPPAPPVPLAGALLALAPPVTKPNPPQPPPPVTPVPPPDPVVTPEPPPVVVQVDPPVVTPPPQPTEPSPPLSPPPPPPPPDGPPRPPPVTPATTVPEPAAWVSMLAGFALAGGALRRRRLATRLSARP